MKRVHCKNCKWLIGTLYCTQLILSKKVDLGEANPRDVKAFYINLGGCCPFYKRKWWKFWVTKGGK